MRNLENIDYDSLSEADKALLAELQKQGTLESELRASEELMEEIHREIGEQPVGQDPPSDPTPSGPEMVDLPSFFEEAEPAVTLEPSGENPDPVVKQNPETSESIARICANCNTNPDTDLLADLAEKQMEKFIHCLFSQQLFTHTFSLYKGKIMLKLRTLTTAEIRAIWSEVEARRKDKTLVAAQEVFEHANNLRFFLQIQEIVFSGSPAIVLPQGLCGETNPRARTDWQTKLQVPNWDKSYLFRQISDYIATNVITNEYVYRILEESAKKFNILLGRLEAKSRDKDFFD